MLGSGFGLLYIANLVSLVFFMLLLADRQLATSTKHKRLCCTAVVDFAVFRTFCSVVRLQ